MASEIILRKHARAQGLPRYFTGKPCKRGHVAERYTRNLTCVMCDFEKQRSDPWHKKNPERHLARGRAWASANPEKRKAWAAAHREELSAYYKRRNQAIDPEVRRAKKRAWYEKNREAAIEYTARWVRDNPEQNKTTKEIVAHRRRARILGTSGTHTPADLRAILQAQGHRCIYCRADLKKTKRHLDHIVPLSRGGSNDRTNLQYTCGPCNLRKAARDPIDFARELGLLL
jgi:5-methylcytosine-specific restriction endonuclease McrA